MAADELVVLQAVRLKGGMADTAMVAAITGADEPQAAGVLEALVAAEHIQDRRGRFRITPAGKEVLDAGLAAERAGLDADAIHHAHEHFTPFNATFKALVTDWQLRDGEPNDHADAAYDGAILERLGALDTEFAPVVAELVAAAPRLAPYPGRFATALSLVREGDSRFLLSPMLDSYHQVWFELHEELIGLAGLNREAEAAAGRAE